MVGYLTPDTIPADTICRVLFIPNDEQFLANVTGALQLLINPDNWTKYGTLTPEESAQALVDMFDRFCFNEGTCRMIGEIIIWAGSSPPDEGSVLLCDGSHVSSVDYPDLWLVIGLTYGGTGSTDFALPDLVGRVAIGASVGHPLAESDSQDTHTLTIAEMPSHDHTTQPHNHTEITAVNADATVLLNLTPRAVPGTGNTVNATVDVDNTGGGDGHNNMQPYLSLNYYIVVQ